MLIYNKNGWKLYEYVGFYMWTYRDEPFLTIKK